MGYSNNKWRKILTILMIINLCFILFARFSRVFGATTYYFNVTELQKNQTEFTFGSSSYGGTRTVKMPSFIYNYKNIVICMLVNPRSNSNKIGCILFSNDDILIDNNTFYGVNGGTYYIKNVSFVSSTSGDFSNYTLADFGNPITLGNNNFIAAGYFVNNSDYTNYSYIALLGSLYDKTTGDIIIDNNPFNAPYFDNVTEIENGYPDGVYISRGDYSENDYLYFHLLKITYTVSDDNETIYYYSPKIFSLDKNSKYYRTWENDPNNEHSYYYVPRSALSLDTNSSYLYVLSNSSDSYTNSYGILEENVINGIYDVIQSDTTGVITSQDSTNDKIQNIDDTLNDNTVSNDTETDIEDSLNFNNQNEGLNNLNGGFFSRLTTMLSNLLGYNLADDTAVSLPLPNSNKSIILHSKDIYDNVTGALRLIINAFWVYIFSFYMWKFINKIYIAVSTGNILDTFSSSGEAITNDML